MKTSSRTVIGRMALVASVLGISMLGNLRLQASEPASMPDITATAIHAPFGIGPHRTSASQAIVQWNSDVDGGDDPALEQHESTDDDGRLVPAIYAWDPDVRFVYFRHVSKWM